MSIQPVRISHRKEVVPDKITSTGRVRLEKGSLKEFIAESDAESLVSIVFAFESPIHFSSFEFQACAGEELFFPNIFRFEISHDGEVWEPILQEHGLSKLGKKEFSACFGLIRSSYIKLLLKIEQKNSSGNYKVSLQDFKILISGISNILVSSENDRYWVKENLIDERQDYGWSSKEKDTPSEEYFLMDFGSVNRIEEIRLLSRDHFDVNFPSVLQVYYSEDDLSWYQLFEETAFLSEKASWYRWRFLPTNMRFIKIVCRNEKANASKNYVVQILEFEAFASADMLDLSRRKNIAETPPYSSIIRPGLVRLAVDGEDKDGVAVQGSDRRLREASSEFKGIVELAVDGEDKAGVVVQGNDSRLKIATENSYGLARLAKNAEARGGLVVQSDDERLKNATESYPGIVELAENGETRPGVVVQGNDKRLKRANTQEYGLTILAEAGDNTPGKVVTGDDPRLKKATTETEGILRFAKNGEDSPLIAVQGNDKRLKAATTELPGIVELAHSGEKKAGVVVQGDDERLRNATEEHTGIMQFAKHSAKMPEKAVQADDPRLYDSREAKEHKHNYAPISHDYNTHTGLIRLTGESSSAFKNIVAPPQNHSVIYGKNTAQNGSGVLGVGEESGVVGFAEMYGLSGYSSGGKDESAGMAGFSRKGYGGFFTSTRNYAVYASGKGSEERQIPGSGKALLADGESLFHGTVRFVEKKGNDCIARYFRVQKSDVIAYGDLIVISEKEGRVARSKNAYSTKVIGVSVESASLEFGEHPADDSYVLVALYGYVMMHVDASEGAIVPGDLLVSGLTGGHAVKADSKRLQAGALIGKALAECRRDRALIPALLTL
ncbi:MAG: discoidin domain-containing protein [Spirochaetota bacterium]